MAWQRLDVTQNNIATTAVLGKECTNVALIWTNIIWLDDLYKLPTGAVSDRINLSSFSPFDVVNYTSNIHTVSKYILLKTPSRFRYEFKSYKYKASTTQFEEARHLSAMSSGQ
jgi:hypothetical protein